MIKKILQWLFTVTGGTIGYFLSSLLLESNGVKEFAVIRGIPFIDIIIPIATIIIFAIISFIISPILIKLVFKSIDSIEKYFQKASLIGLIMGAIGGIIGLLIGVLVSIPLRSIASNSNNVVVSILNIISFIIIFILGLVGADIMIKRREELVRFFHDFKKNTEKKEKKEKSKEKLKEKEGIKEPISIKEVPKVLDTSVIIDGRIFDICKTGFIEGPLIVSRWVLDELRHISDSSDDLKRTKGRRGLDILNKIQKEIDIEVKISHEEFPEIAEVDTKLLKLAYTLKGKVITNDYNLNKVAEVQGVPVLNINELSNAVKPVLLPGEELLLNILKAGKEANQGIGYLDDGTMIVVENGKKRVGEEVRVKVTSVLQTSAGRMIFAALNDR